ncbi:NAD-binding protein [Methylobacterium haplocladii]|uniref:RCK N-terminal domain-containing protein n=1 Tax=Methylobacterium haplocladii TaxID=1176176 RepID=A0A512IU11_9HYPH|nr:NAD-binding protein [Methylobacterium haplocladii]GEP01193.1 hypothetical protein MHA02_35800 [Methylobacterium haplocladii]GJD86332.1 hypothetical protein HPGCJGGD_4238 [Methylobacterium haplocladii]GLS61282.1 hypothetical protein GCM10007887_39820 [Methylobacterium haplocladii]
MAQASSTRGGSQFRNSSWLALAPFAALAFGLAFWGFDQHCVGEPCVRPSTLEQVGKSFDLVRGRGSFGFGKDPWQLVFAQWLMPLAAVLAAAKLFLQSLRRDIKVAFARRSRGHVIVCGLGSTGRAIAEGLREAGERVVTVDLDASSVNALAVEDAGAPTIQGDARSAAVLGIAGLPRARALVVATGNDAANLEIALAAAERSASTFRGAGRLAIVPEMRADWLFERFLSQNAVGLGSAAVEFRILNRSEVAARLLFQRPVFAAFAAGRPARSDIAVIGFGDVGHAVVAHGLRTAFALPGCRLRIAVLDKAAEAAEAKFRLLHPGADAIAEIEPVKAHLTPDQPENCKQLSDLLSARRIEAVFVCIPDDEEALFVATQAREMLDRQGRLAIPVFVRTAERRKLGDILARAQGNDLLPDRLVPFGDRSELLAAGVIADGDVDVLARASHEAYLDTLDGQPGDGPSRQPWIALPELFRRSNRLFADHLEFKLRAAGLRSCPAVEPRCYDLSQQDLETIATAEHGRWLAERRLAGWQYGKKRDDLCFRHPALVEWADLPSAVQDQVRTVVARIPAILARVGREIRRERVVRVDPRAPEAAAAILDRFAPEGGEHLVLALDLTEAAAWPLALRAVSIPNVTLQFLGPPPTRSAGPAGLAAEDVARLRERTDGCVDPAAETRAGDAGEP